MKQKNALYILPNLFTTANMMSGFYSIIESYKGYYLTAAWLLILSVLFDNLDGKIARLTHCESKFGMEYDSLSDLVSFGVAPAFLMYTFALSDMGRIGIIAASLFLLTGALRLARFNVLTTKTIDFVGLPIPGGAIIIASIILSILHFSIDYKDYKVAFLVSVYVISFLMVSTIKYRSFKKIKLEGRISIRVFALILLILSLVIYKPYIFVPLIGISYALSGPIELVIKLFKRGRINHEFQDSKNI
ncbi:CDP-diacylglycerol--serine O-phosphatidyltransferase [Desulfurella sp.]|uniref:CDP-diacylglycerol--serine O-phosphatidyltransferase n=1 Tax=Desulfurella sp. TaxID=1962857 RepID=UPI003D12E8C6